MSVRTKPVDRPRASLLILVRNDEEHLGTTLVSVYAQTFRDIEIVVVDDASSDRSHLVAESFLETSWFQERFSRCSIQGASAPMGRSGALNFGLACSHGEFVGIVEAGDVLAPDRVERMVDAVAPGRTWGFGSVGFVDGAGAPVYDVSASEHRSPEWALSALPTTGLAFLACDAAVTPGNLFFHRRVAECTEPFAAMRTHFGWDFALDAAMRFEPVFEHRAWYHRRLERHQLCAADADREAELAAVFERHALRCSTGTVTNTVGPDPRQWPGLFELVTPSRFLSGFTTGRPPRDR
jgi:glycosyltransferase involved in cell wall biosynthesis